MEEQIHKWEANSIGIAPFELLELFVIPSKAVLEANPEAYNNRMREAPCGVGTCRVCGMPIMNNFIIKDNTGKLFPVGSECVRKRGDDQMTTKMHQLKLKRDRERRAEKAKAVREAVLEKQRAVNGGLTDYELVEQQHQERVETLKAKRMKAAEILAPLAEMLDDGKGVGFRADVAAELRNGGLPWGRGEDIMVDILAKEGGRRGSKAYIAEEERVSNIIDNAREILK